MRFVSRLCITAPHNNQANGGNNLPAVTRLHEFCPKSQIYTQGGQKENESCVNVKGKKIVQKENRAGGWGVKRWRILRKGNRNIQLGFRHKGSFLTS